jgi:DnaK suppressor protein
MRVRGGTRERHRVGALRVAPWILAAARCEGDHVDVERAQALLAAERDEVQKLLGETETAGREDRGTEDETDADIADPAQSLTQQGMDDAIAESLRDRLAALKRAQQRLADGTYGRSVQSGQPIPDERLEADPAAELTVEEAGAREAAGQ